MNLTIFLQLHTCSLFFGKVLHNLLRWDERLKNSKLDEIFNKICIYVATSTYGDMCNQIANYSKANTSLSLH